MFKILAKIFIIYYGLKLFNISLTKEIFNNKEKYFLTPPNDYDIKEANKNYLKNNKISNTNVKPFNIKSLNYRFFK